MLVDAHISMQALSDRIQLLSFLQPEVYLRDVSRVDHHCLVFQHFDITAACMSHVDEFDKAKKELIRMDTYKVRCREMCDDFLWFMMMRGFSSFC